MLSHPVRTVGFGPAVGEFDVQGLSVVGDQPDRKQVRLGRQSSEFGIEEDIDKLLPLEHWPQKLQWHVGDRPVRARSCVPVAGQIRIQAPMWCLASVFPTNSHQDIVSRARRPHPIRPVHSISVTTDDLCRAPAFCSQR